MARHDEPDPATWWERYGHRLHGEPTGPGERETTVADRTADGTVGTAQDTGREPPRMAYPQRQGGEAGPWFTDPTVHPTDGAVTDPTAHSTDGHPPASPTDGHPTDGQHLDHPTAGAARSAAAADGPHARHGAGPAHLRAFDPDSLVRARGPVPDRGWRRVLHAATLGRVDPGPSPAQLAAQDRLARVRSHLAGTHRVAVTSLKGGVGKTTVTACLGLALAEHRGDRILALDANPDAGTLADRLTGHSDRTVRDLLDDLGAIDSWTAVSRYTSLAGRLQVLASEQDPAAGEAFSRDDYLRADEVLARFFSVVITDSGTGMVHSAMAGTLDVADSLVVVGSPTVDGAGRASKTLDWLVAHGREPLVADAVVVLVGRAGREIDTAALRAHFTGRCRAVVEVPHDPHLATGGRIEQGRLRQATREAFLELAAAVAEAFPARAPH
ncbi:AAA family ATPase [Pseudonocardia sp. RS010]|uniref:MinD/ParA family ATP-binding protein n=1 Tax=Pseudonocardia sp. RS010 TaxID=3385979 RepID=UPI0039A15D28